MVPLSTSWKPLNESRRLVMASKVAPRAPTPEASVGVAIPKKILPSTATINNVGGTVDLKTFRSNRSVTVSAFLGVGATEGRNHA